MRIAVLHSTYEHSASPLKDLDPARDMIPVLPDDQVENFFIHKATAVQQVTALSRKGYDIFFNLCDGAWDEDRAGIEVVQVLEAQRVPFIGACSKFFDPSKETMKMVALYYDQNTPAYRFAYDIKDIEEAAAELDFPLIVKHYRGYNSIGMTKASRVTNREELLAQGALVLESFGGVLIEEFIEGREFTVLVAENPDDPVTPITCMPVECTFPPGESFKHCDLKWKDFEGMSWVPVADPVVNEKLRDMARKVFVGLAGDGFARIDVRMNAAGELFFLEVNPNCGIFYPRGQEASADNILQLDPEWNNTKFAKHLIHCGQERWRKKSRKTLTVRYKKGSGFGIFAARDIKAGEVVDKYEERPTPLVSKSYVEAHWGPRLKEWFARYAYPFSQDVFGMWSDNPEDWHPINHSCDPNTWLVGLNTVARRDIKHGEEFTMDYATFCVDTSAGFDCLCGAAQCRGRVNGSDYLLPFVSEVYGTHISDYVRQERAKQASAAAASSRQ